MGRKKIDIKRIQNNRLRNITFKKRMKGLLKKSAELALLCDIKIKMLVKDQNGNPTEFATSEQFRLSKQKIEIHQLFTPLQYPNFDDYIMKRGEEAEISSKHQVIQKKEGILPSITNFSKNEDLENYYKYLAYMSGQIYRTLP